MHRLIALFLLIILVLPASQARADSIDDAYEEISRRQLWRSPRQASTRCGRVSSSSRCRVIRAPPW